MARVGGRRAVRRNKSKGEEKSLPNCAHRGPGDARRGRLVKILGMAAEWNAGENGKRFTNRAKLKGHRGRAVPKRSFIDLSAEERGPAKNERTLNRRTRETRRALDFGLIA